MAAKGKVVAAGSKVQERVDAVLPGVTPLNKAQATEVLRGLLKDGRISLKDASEIVGKMPLGATERLQIRTALRGWSGGKVWGIAAGGVGVAAGTLYIVSSVKGSGGGGESSDTPKSDTEKWLADNGWWLGLVVFGVVVISGCSCLVLVFFLTKK